MNEGIEHSALASILEKQESITFFGSCGNGGFLLAHVPLKFYL